MRCFLLFVATFLSIQGAYSNDIIHEVLARLEKLNPYKVNFDVKYGGESISGFYEVDKDQYYISIDQQELYGDSSVKYEIYNGRKEIVIDYVAADNNGNLLNNPAIAFSSIRDNYSSSVLIDNKDVIVLKLKSIIDVESDETIELTLSKDSKLPVAIVYIIGGESIEIDIKNIKHLSSTITSYDSINYPEYEVIDFR